MDVGSLLRGADERRNAEEELYDLVESNQHLRKIMARHGATRDVLRELYRKLQVTGAGQWAKGHYVSASALAFGATLEFLLTNTDNGKLADRQAWQAVAIRMIDYFEAGRLLQV
jgi:hypothetical protein